MLIATSATIASAITTTGDDKRIERRDAVEHGRQHVPERQQARESQREADRHDLHALAQDEREHLAARAAEREPDANLAPALRDAVREHAVDADRREQQRHGARTRRRAASARGATSAPDRRSASWCARRRRAAPDRSSRRSSESSRPERRSRSWTSPRGHAVLGRLRERVVARTDRLPVRGEPVELHFLDDADDRQPLRVRSGLEARFPGCPAGTSGAPSGSWPGQK